MILHFENVIEAAQQCCLNAGLQATVKDITIIRDVHGRIRVYLEPLLPGKPVDTAVISTLEAALRASLGAYCALEHPVWQPQAKVDAFAVLHRQILDGRTALEPDTTPAFYLLERHIAKQTWTTRQPQQPPWPRTLVEQKHKPAIVSFFSFKGGSGRTSALIATAITMARAGLRVAVCDLDLEAPGLATLLFPEPPAGPGVVDYLLEQPIHGDDWKLRTQLLRFNESMVLGEAGETLQLLPAGTVNEHYLEKLARLDFQSFAKPGSNETLRTMLAELQVAEGPLDFILLDARAGFHDIGGLAISELSHCTVLFGTHTRQNWAGLTRVVSLLAQRREPQPIVLVHTMAPPLSAPGRELELRLFRATAYDLFKEHYYSTEEEVPNQNDDQAPFWPVVIPWNDNLRGDLTLAPRSSEPEEGARLAALLGIMTTGPYRDLSDRLCKLHGRDLRQSETR